jgi:uncharacterized protein
MLFDGISVLKLSFLGLVVGILGALFGVGGGIIMVPALVLIACLPQKTAQGISLAVMVPMALMSFLRYYHTPGLTFDLKVILVLSVAAILGANLGATVMGALSNRALQIGFGLLIIGIGVYMVFKAWRGV